MSEPFRPREPVRLRHVHGEALLARDLTDAADQDEQLRWWHNRALHRAYGIVQGLDVTVGGDTATVAPGLAYDGRGREIRLTRTRDVAVPDDPDARHLVIGRRAGAPGGVALCWVRGTDARRRDVVLLGAAEPGTVTPPRARPSARPRIGSGATIVGATPWREWTETTDRGVLLVGAQVDIDTTAAGFTERPCYFAQIAGSLWAPEQSLLLLVPFDHVTDARRDRFTVRLLMPWLYRAGLTGRGDGPAGVSRLPALSVTWVGIQSTGTEGRR